MTIGLLGAGLKGAPPVEAASSKRCGQVGNRGGTGAAVGIRAKNVSCKRARRVARRCVNSGKHPGWTVARTGRVVRPSNTAEVVLRRGRARIYMGYVGGSEACFPRD